MATETTLPTTNYDIKWAPWITPVGYVDYTYPTCCDEYRVCWDDFLPSMLGGHGHVGTESLISELNSTLKNNKTSPRNGNKNC